MTIPSIPFETVLCSLNANRSQGRFHGRLPSIKELTDVEAWFLSNDFFSQGVKTKKQNLKTTCEPNDFYVFSYLDRLLSHPSEAACKEFAKTTQTPIYSWRVDFMFWNVCLNSTCFSDFSRLFFGMLLKDASWVGWKIWCTWTDSNRVNEIQAFRWWLQKSTVNSTK